MEKTYVIIWRARNSGRTGQSKKVLNLEEANKLAFELNQEYPEYDHLVLNAADPQAKPVPPVAHLITVEPTAVDPESPVVENAPSDDDTAEVAVRRAA